MDERLPLVTVELVVELPQVLPLQLALVTLITTRRLTAAAAVSRFDLDCYTLSRLSDK
jgi:hypothetical protein